MGASSPCVDGLNTAGLKPKAFPHVGEAGLACVSMREGVQAPSLPASLPGQGSLGFPGASGECRAA